MYPWYGAILAAAALILAFPFYNAWLLSCVALVPLFVVLLQTARTWTWRRVFLLGYFFAAVWHIGSLWWVGYVSIAGMFALTLFIALLLAAALTVCWWLVQRGVPALAAAPCCWLVFEATVTYLFTGFPWLLLGNAWRPWLTLAQVAELTGVYGLSALIVLLNVAVTEGVVAAVYRGAWRPAARHVIGVAVLVGVAWCFGAVRLAQLSSQPPQRSWRIAAIQANIPSLVKHDTTKDDEILRRHVILTMRAVRACRPDAVIWPETAIPGYLAERRLSFVVITNLMAAIRIPLLTGLPSYRDEFQPYFRRYFNCAGVIEPNGELGPTYAKKHLVMFGEYVPFERYLPFLSLVTPIEGSYTPGTHTTILVVSNGHAATLVGPLICFEDAFGYLARAMARAGAQVLVNFTNDGWFRNSPEAYQHASLAGFRAIETRRPLVRVTNAGVTIVVDRCGRETAVLERDGRRTGVSGYLFDVVGIHPPITTVYMRCGNWLLLAAILGLLIAIVTAAHRVSR